MKHYILLLLLVLGHLATAQSTKYEIRTNHRSIGTLTVTEKQRNDVTVIEVTSKTQFKMVVTVNLRYHLTCGFKNGQLLDSNVNTYINGKIHSEGIIEQTKRGYLIKGDGHDTELQDSIIYSGAKLYYYEPSEINRVFSEIDGIFKNIERVGDHTYELFNTKGHREATYKYEDGLLQHAEIHHAILTFTLSKI